MGGEGEGFGQPGGEGLLHLGEFGLGAGGDALEEVVGAGDDDAVFGFGGEEEELVEDFGGAELVVVAADEELGGGAVGEEVVGVVAAGGADGEAEADEGCDAGVAAAGAETDVGAEGKACEEDGRAVETVEVVDCGADVFDLAAAFIVDALREAGAAEVEAEGGDGEVGEGLHGVVDDLVVHGAAGGRVGVGDEGGEGGVRGTGVEDGFETAGRAVEIFKGADLGGERHKDSMKQGEAVRGRVRQLVCLGSMAIDALELTRKLVQIESTTYHEYPAGVFLEEFLKGEGWTVERMAVPKPAEGTPGAAGGGERFNVYAEMAGGAEVVLSTHMDTVPPYVGFREDEEYLYGRGACDAKGIIAAQVAAAERLRDLGVKVGMLFVVGEERDSAGAKVANGQARGSRFLINGEPTDNRMALATKGALRVELYADGTMAHSAYPELGDSAIDKLVEVLADIQRLELPVVDEIGDTTVNVGLISGGRAPNVIADKAEAHLLIRLVGPTEEVTEAIERCVAGRVRVEYSLDLKFVRMRTVGDGPTMIAKFATDIPTLTNWGEPFLLGPGSIHVAHTPDERIAKKELLACVELYVELAKGLVGMRQV